MDRCKVLHNQCLHDSSKKEMTETLKLVKTKLEGQSKFVLTMPREDKLENVENRRQI